MASHADCSAVGCDDPFNHGKPKPGTALCVACPGGIDLIETLPDFIQLVFRDADAVIANGTDDFLRALGECNQRMAAFPAIGDAVGDEVDEQPHHHGFIRPQQHFGLQLRLQEDSFRFSRILLFQNHHFDELAEVDEFIMECLLPIVCPGQKKQLIDQDGHLSGLGRDDAEAVAQFFRGQIFL